MQTVSDITTLTILILAMFRHYSCPYIPNFPGLQDFTGKVTHSHEYRCPEPYVNQRVLVIGGGPSGIDISLDLSKTSNKVCYCEFYLKSIAIILTDLQIMINIIISKYSKNSLYAFQLYIFI